MNSSPLDREGFAAFLLRMRAAGLDDKFMMAAFEAVPRRLFMRSEFHDCAWRKGVIPIDCGEVLESADLQARIIRALDVGQDSRVLEIGTGSGFTGVVMSKLAKRIYTVERFKTLHEQATERFRTLKIDNIISIRGNGFKGCSDGPFDRIIVWAAFEVVPRHFVEQLVSGGILICAVGHADEPQELVRLTKVGSRYEREDLGLVRMQMLNSTMPAIL